MPDESMRVTFDRGSKDVRRMSLSQCTHIVVRLMKSLGAKRVMRETTAIQLHAREDDTFNHQKFLTHGLHSLAVPCHQHIIGIISKVANQTRISVSTVVSISFATLLVLLLLVRNAGNAQTFSQLVTV